MDSNKPPASSLADLMELEVNPRRVWQTHELGAILHHQLSAPLQVELGELRLGVADLQATADRYELMSFGDLLHHPCPPVQVLEMVKDFAKHNLSSPLAPLPAEVATAIYFCSILVALARCGRGISTLDTQAIIKGGEWVLIQPWVEPSLKALCEDALNQLKLPPDAE